VVLWGTGRPTREVLYVDDAARGLVLVAERYDSSEPINIGTGKETSIRELAELVCGLVGFEGETAWDASRPDGQPRRYLDIGRAQERLGFEAEMLLEEGLRRTIESFRTTTAAQPA
jgi:GDP-L-fucose synthase